MTREEIKKALYKERPPAFFEYFRKGILYYTASISGGVHVTFSVPANDTGDADFMREMDAKLLIRYISN